MTQRARGQQLPCGRSWAALLDRATDGQQGAVDEHTRGCPHCTAALQELALLWEPVRRLAAERVAAPPGLTARVMRRVREVAQDSWHALLPNPRGATRVATRVIAALARQAAARVPGVTVAFGRTTDPSAAARTAAATDAHHWPGAAVGVAGSSAVVDLALAAAYGTDLHQVAQRVRDAVIRDVTELGGLQHVQVNVTIDDVWP